MPQHSKITLAKVEDLLDLMEHANLHDERKAFADLLRMMPVVDQFLVKHGRLDLARSLRRAFDKVEDGI